MLAFLVAAFNHQLPSVAKAAPARSSASLPPPTSGRSSGSMAGHLKHLGLLLAWDDEKKIVIIGL